MFSTFAVLCLLSPVFIEVISWPMQDAGISSRRTQLRANIKHPRSRTSNTTHGIPLFDASYAAREYRNIFVKYAQASKFLAGIDLNPDTHPEAGYAPFAGGGIVDMTQFANSTSPHGISSTGDVSAEVQPNVIVPINVGTTGTATQPLMDDISGGSDIEYYETIYIGTPAQDLTVQVDTGSADLWVPVNCRNCALNPKQFQSKSSSTFKTSDIEFSLTYGSGQVSGKLATDVVSIGQLTMNQQVFGAVNSESSDFQGSPSGGIIGLAFGTIASSKSPTFVENLMSQKKIAAGIFSVHLTRGEKTGSEVCFGCYDASFALGPVTWNPLISRTYWSIAMNGLAASSTQSISTNLIAAIDTGTTLIYVPYNVADNFYALIPGSGPAVGYGEGFYTYPCQCDSALDVSFTFGTQTYSINILDFNLGQTSEGSSDCVGGIVGMPVVGGFASNLAIVGDEFLKSWYSVYDYPGNRVGFAADVNNSP